MASNKYVVIGLGQFGMAIAVQLAQKGLPVMAIDNSEDNIETIKDEVAMAVVLDATDKKALMSQNVQEAEAVVVSIGDDFEALLLCVAHLQDLGVKRLIARANGPQQRKILEKMGVHEILSPENEVGKNVAERLHNPSILTFLELPDDYEIAEIRPPKSIVNRSLQDISLRDKYNLNLVTIKREYDEKVDGELKKMTHVLGVPKSETVIYETDTIVIFGTAFDVQKFIEINN